MPYNRTQITVIVVAGQCGADSYIQDMFCENGTINICSGFKCFIDMLD